MKVKTELFLPQSEKPASGAGSLRIQGKKFHLKIGGDPSYAMIFDGKILWYQPDLREKTVFKFEAESHPMIHLISGVFHPERFFELFSPDQFEKRGPKYIFRLTPKKKLEGAQAVFAAAGRHIELIQIHWSGLGSRQAFKFQNPWFKSSFPESAFAFSPEGFEVISRGGL